MASCFPRLCSQYLHVVFFLEQRPGRVWLIWMRLRWSWVSAVQYRAVKKCLSLSDY